MNTEKQRTQNSQNNFKENYEVEKPILPISRLTINYGNQNQKKHMDKYIDIQDRYIDQTGQRGSHM